MAQSGDGREACRIARDFASLHPGYTLDCFAAFAPRNDKRARHFTSPRWQIENQSMLAEQHVAILNLAIRLTHGLELELSDRLECLNAASGNDGAAGNVSIRGSPIDFCLGVGVPDRQYDDVSLTVIDDDFWRRADAKGAAGEGLEFVDLAEINLLSVARNRQNDGCGEKGSS
jgi:hypothetical protein